MKRAKKWFLLSAMVLIVISAVEIFAEQTQEKPTITIRKSQPQTVLYTIYRGSYDKIGQAIGGLYALAGQKDIKPLGPLCCAYLNNPQHVSSEHRLTEIRIPVGEEAMKLAGSLGEMTDVKAVPAMDVAVVVKPEGVADPGSLYEALGLWIHKEGYATEDGPIEVYLTGGAGMSYAQMKSEIMVAVKKFEQNTQ